MSLALTVGQTGRSQHHTRDNTASVVDVTKTAACHLVPVENNMMNERRGFFF